MWWNKEKRKCWLPAIPLFFHNIFKGNVFQGHLKSDLCGEGLPHCFLRYTCHRLFQKYS